ncbi:hypothetical protein BC938DRAFT_482720 [Jimgerdemannia flammicorona]|uniref:Uncharacterized protein n=1 Tax=Jimgerdemannia flammicorona TaxID=994334 RepID=A0A433QDG4_9FUNG|nr:hypothetical protein BC938DRAFT_482720 [Jimgerdemannia flammicorona]
MLHNSHGSAGLAGQYRFGARTEVSIIFLGLLKLLVGVLFSSSLIGLLQFFPRSILAVMLFVSGAELAMASRSINLDVDKDEIQRENYLVMLVTMGMLVAFKNDGIGFGDDEEVEDGRGWKEKMPAAAAPEIVIEEGV